MNTRSGGRRPRNPVASAPVNSAPVLPVVPRRPRNRVASAPVNPAPVLPVVPVPGRGFWAMAAGMIAAVGQLNIGPEVQMQIVRVIGTWGVMYIGFEIVRNLFH